MLTERQQYSIENQTVRIRDFAARKDIEIVQIHAGVGMSGLEIGCRDGLQSLLSEVRAKNADFELILVYDGNSWGRFQVANESVRHEYTCKQAGSQVVYCAEC